VRASSALQPALKPHTDTDGLVVKSRHLVERVEPEPFGLECPSFADELVGREPLQGLARFVVEFVAGDLRPECPVRSSLRLEHWLRSRPASIQPRAPPRLRAHTYQHGAGQFRSPNLECLSAATRRSTSADHNPPGLLHTRESREQVFPERPSRLSADKVHPSTSFKDDLIASVMNWYRSHQFRRSNSNSLGELFCAKYSFAVA
jgi:hypothetical protein